MIAPLDVGFSPVELISEDDKIIISPDVYVVSGFKEAGVPINLKSNKSIAVVFNWESASTLDLRDDGEYILKIFKQSGVSSYPVQVQIKTPENLSISTQPEFGLTLMGTVGYNTELQEDKSLRLFWKNE